MQFFTCFWASLKLGLTSFGGPVAHLGYFRDAYVVKHGWVSEERFGELLALCQFLPGPASSQFGAAIGYEKGGWFGALGSWLGFTLPSAILMILLAVGLAPLSELVGVGWIHGLKLAAVAIVALAVMGMRKKLCPGLAQLLVAAGALLLLTFTSQTWMQPLVILLGGIVGAIFFADYKGSQKEKNMKRGRIPIFSVVGILLFLLGLTFLPMLAGISSDGAATAGLLQSGSLVFGGGHVVLPLLETSFVGSGLLEQDKFLAGYGAAQAVPGPMFTLSSYLGAIVNIGGGPWIGGLIATVAIFAPGMYLLAIGLPLWDWLKGMPRAKGAIVGANAAVVGLLAAALVHMLAGKVITSGIDLLIVIPLFIALTLKKIPAWLAVLIAGVAGGFLA